MGNLSRRKGLGYENRIAGILREHGFPDAGRHLEFQKDEARGFDLKNTGVFRIQCKRYRSYAPVTKLEEVKPERGTVPLLVTRADRKPDVVVLYLKDFLKLIHPTPEEQE